MPRSNLKSAFSLLSSSSASLFAKNYSNKTIHKRAQMSFFLLLFSSQRFIINYGRFFKQRNTHATVSFVQPYSLRHLIFIDSTVKPQKRIVDFTIARSKAFFQLLIHDKKKKPIRWRKCVNWTFWPHKLTFCEQLSIFHSTSVCFWFEKLISDLDAGNQFSHDNMKIPTKIRANFCSFIDEKSFQKFSL